MKEKHKHLFWRPRREPVLHPLMGTDFCMAIIICALGCSAVLLGNYFILEKKKKLSLFWVVQGSLSQSLQAIQFVCWGVCCHSSVVCVLGFMCVCVCACVCVKTIFLAPNSRFSKGKTSLINWQEICLAGLRYWQTLVILQKRKETFRFCSYNQENIWIKAHRRNWLSTKDWEQKYSWIIHEFLAGSLQSFCC